MPTSIAAPNPDQALVLSKAVARAAERWALPKNRLARVVGISAPSVSRLYAGTYQLDPGRKEWELVLLFVRAYRSLDSIVGDDQVARAWLHSPNRALGGRPVDLIENAEGLVRVVHYLDASRGRI